MKKRLFTSILVMMAAMALPSSVWADTETAVTETYDFATFIASQTSADGGNISPTSITVNDTQNQLTVSGATMYGLEYDKNKFGTRFAIGRKNSVPDFKFMYKTDSKYRGLYTNYADRYFTILNLKGGDEITIKFIQNNASQLKLRTALTTTSGNIEAETALSETANATQTVTYTIQESVELTSLDLVNTGDANLYINFITIKTKKTSGTSPVEIALPATDYKSDATWTSNGITFTWGNDTWTRWSGGSFSSNSNFTQRANGSAIVKKSGSETKYSADKGIPSSGNYIKVQPTKSGILTIHGEFKYSFYVVDDYLNEQMTTNALGNSLVSSSLSFSVVGEQTYYVFDDNAGDARFWGFSFYDPEATATQYGITIGQNISNGSLEASATSATAGTTITLTATPDSGYEVDKYIVEGAEQEGNTFEMPANDVTVSVTFKKKKYTLSTSVENGTITLKKNNAEGEAINSGDDVEWGTTIYVTATPTDTNNYLSSLKYGNTDVASGATFAMPQAETTVTATFAARTDISGATVTLSSNSLTHTGSAQAPTVTEVSLNETKLAEGTDYSVNEIAQQTEVGSNYTITVTGIGKYKGTATATWAIVAAAATPKVTITDPTSSEGSISVENGETAVTSGVEIAESTSLTLTATPKSGYQLKTWKDGTGNALGTLPKSLVQTYSMPSSDVSITAEFEAVPSITKVTQTGSWNFSSFNAGTILSNQRVYGLKTDLGTLYFNGGSKNAYINSNKELQFEQYYSSTLSTSNSANAAVGASIAFQTGVGGTVSVTLTATSNKKIHIYEVTNSEVLSVSADATGSSQTLSKVVSKDSHIFIACGGDNAKYSEISFSAESVTAPTFTNTDAIVTVTAGVSTLESSNVDMKTYYQINANENAELTVNSEGWQEIPADGKITLDATGYVYAYSINDKTKTTSAVSRSEQVSIAVVEATAISAWTSWQSGYGTNNGTITTLDVTNTGTGLYARGSADHPIKTMAYNNAYPGGTLGGKTFSANNKVYQIVRNDKLNPGTADAASTITEATAGALAMKLGVSGKLYLAVSNPNESNIPRPEIFVNGTKSEFAYDSWSKDEYKTIEVEINSTSTVFIGSSSVGYDYRIGAIVFSPKHTITNSTASDAHGTITVAGEANAGETVTLTVTPASGYELESLTVVKTGGTSTTVDVTDYKFTMPDYDVTVSATFKQTVVEPTQYTVTAESEDESKGTVAITDASSDNKYDKGLSVTITATAKSGYEFDYWTNGDGTDSYSTDNPLTITDLSADLTLKAHFKKGETVTPPTCEAATDGKVSTADGKVTIIAGRSDNSEATVTTYYKTSLFADVPEIDESWSTLPDNGVVTMEKSGYIFVYAKSSTGVLTGITTIDVELPVYGKYDFAGIATENVEDGNSNPQAITWSNGNLIVGENTIGLNRTFSGDKIALRRTTSDQGLYVQYDAGYLTISRLNVNDIVKVEYSAGSLDIKSGTADPLGNTTDGHSTASYVIKGGNDLSLNVSKAAWIYSVEISNDDAVSAPVISVSDSKEITINGGTSLQGKAVTVYYTTDGTTPTTSSTVYTAPFTPEKTVYIKAFSVITNNINIQSPVAEQKVSIGTYEATKNVFDFAALAGDFGEFAFAETAVSLNEYWNTSTPNEDRDFYEITNTDHFTSVDNSVQVLMRGKTGNTLSYADGGMTGSNSGLIALTGLTEGQRIIVEYKENGSVRYNTGVGQGEVTVGGNTLEQGATISSGAVVTVKSGNYIVLYNVANSTITKISVLDPAVTYSVGLPSSTEHGTVEANMTSAGEGETVTLTVTPADGYVVESVTVKDADNSTVEVTTVTANSTYTFDMPAKNVTVSVVFAEFVEATVGVTRNWTFDDLSGTYTEIKEVNGAYLRGFGTRTFTVTDGEEQTLTFADGEKVTVSKYLAVGHSMYPLAFTESSTAASTATKANSSNVEELIGAGSFAVNTTVAGTIYAKIGTPTDQKVRIYCTDAIDSPKTFELKAADGIQEVSYTTTAENGGTFFIGGVEGMYDIYAVRFVPTSEATKYTLTVGVVTNGTITVKDGSTTIDGSAQVLPGATLTLTATPADGYQLKEWQDGNGSAIGAIQNSMVTTVAMPAEAMTVKAVFEAQPTSVTAITKDQTLTFDSYTTGISLSGSKVYAASDNLYINGHSDSAPAQVTANGISEGVTLGSATGVTVGKSLWMRGGNDKDLSGKAVNSYVQDAIGLNISEKGLLYVLLSGKTSDTDRYFNIYVNGVKNQTKIADNNPVVISQAITAETSDVFITVSGGDWRAYAIRFEAVSFTEQETDDTESGSKVYAVVTDDGATIAAASIAEEDETITISEVDDKPVTDIAAGVFTESNTANVSAIDLSETQVTMAGERTEIPALKNIDASTLIYLPSTASVTGTNVVVKSSTSETYTCSDFEVDNGKLENGKSVVVPKEFKADKVTLKRTFTADKKCTVCLPYPFTATGGTFYKFTGISGGKVQMEAQVANSTLVANTPYIFVPSSNAEGISTGSVTVSISDAPETQVNEANFKFKGTYKHETFNSPSGIYGFASEDGQFVRVGTGAEIMACRAYLEYTGTGNLDGTQVATTRGMNDLPDVLEIEWIPASGKGTTGIEDARRAADDSEAVYNMRGQRVDKSYKGLVIVNGKKVVRK